VLDSRTVAFGAADKTRADPSRLRRVRGGISAKPDPVAGDLSRA